MDGRLSAGVTDQLWVSILYGPSYLPKGFFSQVIMESQLGPKLRNPVFWIGTIANIGASGWAINALLGKEPRDMLGFTASFFFQCTVGLASRTFNRPIENVSWS